MLGMESLGLTAASFRAGGATALFLANVEVARIRLIRRWRNLQTLDSYTQEAAACSVLHQLDGSPAALAQELCSLAGAFRRPPGSLWWAYFARSCQRPFWTWMARK